MSADEVNIVCGDCGFDSLHPHTQNGEEMKNIAMIVLVMFTVIVTGCAESIVFEGKVVEPYGLLSVQDKEDCIVYHTSVGNVVWSILLFETIFAPFYFLGWELYEPVAGVADCRS